MFILAYIIYVLSAEKCVKLITTKVTFELKGHHPD